MAFVIVIILLASVKEISAQDSITRKFAEPRIQRTKLFAKLQADSIVSFFNSNSPCPQILKDPCFEVNYERFWYLIGTDTALKYYVVDYLVNKDSSVLPKLQAKYFKKEFKCDSVITDIIFMGVVEMDYIYNRTSYYDLIEAFLNKSKNAK